MLVLGRICERCEGAIEPRQRINARGQKQGWNTPERFCSPSCATATRNENGAAGWLDKHGYRIIRIGGQEVPEHRAVMERMIGRPLRPEETVHHKNGVRNDNAESNLELWSGRQPGGQRVQDKIDFYIDFLRSYGFEVTAPGAMGLMSSAPASDEP